jgi:formylglycine-generating enzyme required for sulfatase activity
LRDEPLLGFVEVPEGPFLMGTREEDIPALMERLGGERRWYEREVPQHEVTLPTYYIARYPVTHAQYAAFVRETGHEPPTADIEAERPYEWREGHYPPQRANQPVVLVTWHDALAYCRWLTEKLREWKGTPEPLATLLREQGWAVTLPSEAEWEKAARGTDGRQYPWGDDPDRDRANYGDTGIGTTSAVGCFPGGASPCGVEDMSGNVWEWCRTKWRDSYGNYRDDDDLEGDVLRVLRGGSWSDVERLVRCAYRSRNQPRNRNNNLGFRLLVASHDFHGKPEMPGGGMRPSRPRQRKTARLGPGRALGPSAGRVSRRDPGPGEYGPGGPGSVLSGVEGSPPGMLPGFRPWSIPGVAC